MSSVGKRGAGRGPSSWDPSAWSRPGPLQSNKRKVLVGVPMTGLGFSSLPNAGVASPLQCLSSLALLVGLTTGFSVCFKEE